jgi:hypothetical protein
MRGGPGRSSRRKLAAAVPLVFACLASMPAITAAREGQIPVARGWSVPRLVLHPAQRGQGVVVTEADDRGRGLIVWVSGHCRVMATAVSPTGVASKARVVGEGGCATTKVAENASGEAIILWQAGFSSPWHERTRTATGVLSPIHTFTGKYRSVSGVAESASGEASVLVSDSHDGFALQRIGANGELGPAVQLLTSSTPSNPFAVNDPLLAMDSSGNAVVAWEEPSHPAGASGRRGALVSTTYAERVAADGDVSDSVDLGKTLLGSVTLSDAGTVSLVVRAVAATHTRFVLRQWPAAAASLTTPRTVTTVANNQLVGGTNATLTPTVSGFLVSLPILPCPGVKGSRARLVELAVGHKIGPAGTVATQGGTPFQQFTAVDGSVVGAGRTLSAIWSPIDERPTYVNEPILSRMISPAGALGPVKTIVPFMYRVTGRNASFSQAPVSTAENSSGHKLIVFYRGTPGHGAAEYVTVN